MKSSPEFDKIKSQISSLQQNPKAIMAIVLIFLLFDVVVLLRFQFHAVAKMFTKATQLKTDITNAQTDAHFLSTYKNRQSDLKSEIAALEKRIIAQEGLPRVIETISKHADLSMVRILKINPVSDSASRRASLDNLGTDHAGQFQGQKVSIIAKCGFHQLGRFIALLESSPVFLDIKTVEIRLDDQEYMKQMVTIVLEVLVRKA